MQLQDTGQGVGQAGGASTASKYEYHGKGERASGIAKTVRAVLTYVWLVETIGATATASGTTTTATNYFSFTTNKFERHIKCI